MAWFVKNYNKIVSKFFPNPPNLLKKFDNLSKNIFLNCLIWLKFTLNSLVLGFYQFQKVRKSFFKNSNPFTHIKTFIFTTFTNMIKSYTILFLDNQLFYLSLLVKICLDDRHSFYCLNIYQIL